MPGPHTYNADQVLVQFAGITAREKGKDEFVRIKRGSAAFTLSMSVDGFGTFETTNDDSAVIEIILTATSPVNALYTAVHAADKASKNGAGIAPLNIKDLLSDTELHFAEHARITTEPEVTYARGVGERIWTLMTPKLRSVHGGH